MTGALTDGTRTAGVTTAGVTMGLVTTTGPVSTAYFQ